MADFKKYGRTANLFDTSNAVIDKYVTANGDIADGVLPNYNFNYITIPVTPNSQYSFSFGYVVSTVDIGTYMGTHRRIIAYDSNGDFLSQIVDIQPNNNYTGGGTFTTPNNCYYISINYINTEKPNYDTNMMLNAGSTVLPYQPYLDWQHSLRKQCTATETITTLPVDIYADGTAATVSLKGNEQHTGTPSPSNPVEVNGVGVRTENLFDGSYTDGYIGGDTGTRYSTSSSAKTAIVKCEPNTTYTIKKITSSNRFTIATSASYPQDSEIVNVLFSSPTKTTATITTPADASYLLIYVSTSSEQATPDMMLNAGSTAKPYEPYGYKIPISSGGVTTNIYLGSTQSTRKIKKLVLDGTEDWTRQSVNNYGIANFQLAMPDRLTGTDTIGFVSHFERQTTSISVTQSMGYYIGGGAAKLLYLRCDSTIGTDRTDFTAWLAAQYANGTPVTVWYVLASETTGIVNEPLMKIGDYADTLSNAMAIPTTEGANSISVDTTVQPSEFTATWTGWHDSTVKEWDGSQWE